MKTKKPESNEGFPAELMKEKYMEKGRILFFLPGTNQFFRQWLIPKNCDAKIVGRISDGINRVLRNEKLFVKNGYKLVWRVSKMRMMLRHSSKFEPSKDRVVSKMF